MMQAPMGGRGGFGGGGLGGGVSVGIGGGGHINPAFMQNQGGQFTPDGPRKRYRMEQGG